MRCKALKPTSDSRLQDFLGTLQSFSVWPVDMWATPLREVNSPKVDPQFYRCPATMGNDWGSCHGYTDRGRVERGIERELYFTEPPDFHISPISSGLRWRGERYIPKNVLVP